MNLQQIMTASEAVDLVEIENGQPVTTSLRVAEYFGKNHKEVLRDIRDKVTPFVSESFAERNFALSYYRNAQSKEQPMYILTRDGFTMVAMGYTGARATKFKEDYITAFNRMEEAIRGKRPNSDDLVDRAAQKVAAQLLPQFFKTIAPTLAKTILEQVRSLPQGEALLPPTPVPPTPEQKPKQDAPPAATTKQKRGTRTMRYTIYTWKVISTARGLEAVDKQAYTTTNRATYMAKLLSIVGTGLQYAVVREDLGVATI